VSFHDLDQPIGRRTVEGRIRFAHQDSWADRLGLENAHARLYPEITSLPRRGHDGGCVGRVSGDGERPAAERRIVLLLDRGEGAVEVDDECRRIGSVETQLL
jgi:hypothetical protein